MSDARSASSRQPESGAAAHPLEEAAAQAAANPSDKAALAELFNALYEPVVRYMQARVYDPCLAEDLAQDVFVKLVQGIGRYTGGGIYGWVWAIARSTAADHFRPMRNRGYETPTGEIWQLDAPSADMGPEELAEWADLRVAINRKLSKLPDDQQEVLRLRLIAGLSTAEVAEVMAKPAGTIRVLQCRALAKLRKLMPEGNSSMASLLLSATDPQQEQALMNAAPVVVTVREIRHAESR
jgi:RNA polymerase sigma-70 factor (ECF subfamily)